MAAATCIQHPCRATCINTGSRQVRIAPAGLLTDSCGVRLAEADQPKHRHAACRHAVGNRCNRCSNVHRGPMLILNFRGNTEQPCCAFESSCARDEDPHIAWGDDRQGDDVKP